MQYYFHVRTITGGNEHGGRIEMNITRETALEYRRRVCIAMNYISRNLRIDLPLEDIAKEAAFSMFHFHRIFRAVVGETVSEFTWRLRLEAAANRLRSGARDSVTAIALDCGFSSSQNFARAFRQRFDMSPSAYRNSKTGNTAGKGGNVLAMQVRYFSDEDVMNLPTNTRNIEMNADIKNMPDLHVAYVRILGPYGKETSQQAFGELMQWAGPNGHIGSGPMLGMYWDNPDVTPPDKCRTDACLVVPAGTVPTGQVGLQTIAGGQYAVCHFDIKDGEFQKAWEEAFAWLVQSGRECDDKPCFELYHNNGFDDPEGRWRFDICIPLKRG
jgi:AraC family transcriptional regulator